MKRKWTLLTLLLLALPTLAWAQNSGKLAGTITDAESGEPLPGATVLIEGTALGAATDVDGSYVILEVPPGFHNLIVSYVGYTTLRQERVEVIGGITTRLDFALGESAMELQVVQVTAERPLVNPTATNAVRRLSREELDKLPTRDATTFYAIQPGVTLMNDEVYVRGGRPDETEFMLEGISARSAMGTDNVIPVIPEALEEIQVYAGGYSAEFGGANAGIVQQVLRTGGEQLSALVQYETDRGGTGAFGGKDTGFDNLTVTLGGPLYWKQHRFFAAVDYQQTDNYAPMFFYGADLGLPVDDITHDTATTALKWDDGVLPGIGRPQEQLRLNGTLLFNFNPLRLRFGFAHLGRTRRINDLPIDNLYNQERLPQRDDVRDLANLQASYFLSGSTFVEGTVGFFRYNYETYDPLFGKPEADGEGGAVLNLLDYYSRDAVAEALADDPALAEEYTRYWRGDYTQPYPFQFNAFKFDRPGSVTTSYARREQSYLNGSLALVSQQDIHELRLGGHFQRWTIRDYGLSAASLAAVVQNDPTYLDKIKAESDEVAYAIRRDRWGGFGYDEFMNKVDDGPDGPKHPVSAALYVNDKLEFNDIVVNAGLRLDYFDMDLWTVDDPTNPGLNRADWTVEGLKKASAKTYVQPRLGLSFPVTDRTVFHLQYGKFAQMPDLLGLYARRSWIATVLSGQFMIRTPFAWELDPITSTQYEIGLGHQFTDFAAFDLTAFYRKTEGQVEIVRERTAPSAAAGNYNRYVNGDFTVARGIELSLRTRRVANFMGIFNYTLTDAKGTNSEPSGQVAALEAGTAPPSLIQPLGFEQRHRASLVLDYRSGRTKSPLWQEWTADLLFSMNSGHRFTMSSGNPSQRDADEGPLLVDTDPRGRVPDEPLNASTTPWFFNTDLRVEKGFAVGKATATAFLYVQNLFNTKNVINVYNRTGSADNDGFFTTPELSEQILEGQGEAFARYYEEINLRNREHYIRDWGYDLYATPRQVRLGLRLEL